MRALLAAVLFLSFAAPRSANAQEDGEAKAMELLGEADAARQAGDFLTVLEKAEEAQRIHPGWRSLLAIGDAFYNLGRYTEALVAYESFLDFPAERRDANFESMVPAVHRVLEELGALVGRLRITVSEPGARLVVDGKEIGTTEAETTIRVDPGPHHVLAEKEGFTPARAAATVGEGGEQVIRLNLRKIEPKVITEQGPPIIIEAPPPRFYPTAGKLGGVVSLVVDPGGPGAAMMAGGTYGVWQRLDVVVGAIVGGEMGIYAGGTFYVLNRVLRPTISLGMPGFFADGFRPGIRGAVGLEWSPVKRFSLALHVAGEHYPAASSREVATMFVPALSIHLRR